MSERRIARAAQFSRTVDNHRKVHEKVDDGQNCVNWQCDGTRHRDLSGRKWGSGWSGGSSERIR